MTLSDMNDKGHPEIKKGMLEHVFGDAFSKQPEQRTEPATIIKNKTRRTDGI